jgi:urease accessory protein
VANPAEELLRQIAHSPLCRRQRVAFAASPLNGGAIVRLAGVGPEPVGRWLRDRLSFVSTLLGEDPWARKW